MSELSRPETASWVAELEWPQEVCCLLEVGADSVNLVDQIFHTDDTVFAEVLLDEGVVSQGNALLVDLSVTTLVDELADGLQVGVTVSNPWLDDLQHLEGGLCHSDENTVVDLKETEELEDLAWLWCNLVDTLDTNHEDKFVLVRNVEGAISLSQTSKADLLALCVTVFLDVLLGTLEDDTTLLLLSLLLLLELSRSLLASLLLALALLEQSLWDKNLVGSGDGPV